MKSKTKEEIEAEIEIHKRTGAHRKVELLEERLAVVCGSVQPASEPETCSDLADTDFDVRCQDAVDLDSIVENLDIIGDPMGSAYVLKTKTVLSWKEIAGILAIEKPQGLWAKVKKFAKDNDLPYNA